MHFLNRLLQIRTILLAAMLMICSLSYGTEIQLGDDTLTRGIPGTGVLTENDIRGWLDQASSHEILQIELPLGLAAGRGQIVGLKENPLTRAKIELGRQLYFDTRLSVDNTVSCASCHHPDNGFARNTRFGVGVRKQEGGRNSPISYNRILSAAQFWDGRAASLEEQAVGPIANPIEMGNTHGSAVKTLKGIPGYAMQFQAVFGEDAVTIQNVGRAIASFERILVTGPSAYDFRESYKRFAQLDEDEISELEEDAPVIFAEFTQLKKMTLQHPMSESAVRGQELFFNKRGGCSACHVGANLADEKYHNLGIGMDAAEPDLGRFVVTKVEKERGAFKTPTVRNVVYTAPYMHDGSLQTLEQVVEHYNKGGTKNKWLSDKVKPLKLTDQEKADLVNFMKACTGSFPRVERARLPK